MKSIWDWIYPKRCVFCNRILPWEQDELVCDFCQVDTWRLPSPGCRICSRPVEREGAVCRSCLVHQTQVTGYSLFSYEGLVKESIHRFKYDGQRRYGREYARLLFRLRSRALQGVGMIVPIPIHPARRRERGYNQAEEIGRELAACQGIICRNLLIRVRNTAPLHALTAKRRRDIVKNAFEVQDMELPAGDLLLVDDIYTSGSTIEEAALTLRQRYPAKTVRFLTLAMVVPSGED